MRGFFPPLKVSEVPIPCIEEPTIYRSLRAHTQPSSFVIKSAELMA